MVVCLRDVWVLPDTLIQGPNEKVEEGQCFSAWTLVIGLQTSEMMSKCIVDKVRSIPAGRGVM